MVPVAEAGATVAVSVIACPETAVAAEAARVTAVVWSCPAAFTWTDTALDVDAPSAASPAYDAVMLWRARRQRCDGETSRPIRQRSCTDRRGAIQQGDSPGRRRTCRCRDCHVEGHRLPGVDLRGRRRKSGGCGSGRCSAGLHHKHDSRIARKGVAHRATRDRSIRGVSNRGEACSGSRYRPGQLPAGSRWKWQLRWSMPLSSC